MAVRKVKEGEKVLYFIANKEAYKIYKVYFAKKQFYSNEVSIKKDEVLNDIIIKFYEQNKDTIFEGYEFKQK